MLDDYGEVLKALSENSDKSKYLLDILHGELSMPNIPTPTMGGKVWWNTISEYGGWKLQQNMFWHHARILNSDDVRIAWGSIEAMEKTMNRLVSGLNTYKKSARESSENRMNTMEEIKKLKELLDIGAISQEEFEEKKSKLMKQL